MATPERVGGPSAWPGQVHHPRRRLHGDVEAGLLSERPRLAVGGDGADDDRRVNVAERVVVEEGGLRRAGGVVVDYYIG